MFGCFSPARLASRRNRFSSEASAKRPERIVLIATTRFRLSCRACARHPCRRGRSLLATRNLRSANQAKVKANRTARWRRRLDVGQLQFLIAWLRNQRSSAPCNGDRDLPMRSAARRHRNERMFFAGSWSDRPYLSVLPERKPVLTNRTDVISDRDSLSS
jgi:hypothetical protein